MCHVYELDKKIKEMTLEELCKEYNAILTKFNQRSNQNYWERLNQPKNVKLRLKIKEKKDMQIKGFSKNRNPSYKISRKNLLIEGEKTSRTEESAHRNHLGNGYLEEST